MRLDGIRRAWHDGRLRWWAWAALLAASMLELAAGARDLLDSRFRSMQVQAALAAAALASAASGPPQWRPPPDAADVLPAVPREPRAVLGELQRACRHAGVRIVSQSAARFEATVESLGRLQWELELLGRYRDIKAALATVLARHPEATVRSVRLHAEEPSPEGGRDDTVRATVTLVLWSGPARTSSDARGR